MMLLIGKAWILTFDLTSSLRPHLNFNIMIKKTEEISLLFFFKTQVTFRTKEEVPPDKSEPTQVNNPRLSKNKINQASGSSFL